MSRIGKKPVSIPAGVTVDIAAGNNVTVKGPKGSLTYAFHPDMILKVEGNTVIVDRPDEEHLQIYTPNDYSHLESDSKMIQAAVDEAAKVGATVEIPRQTIWPYCRSNH